MDENPFSSEPMRRQQSDSESSEEELIEDTNRNAGAAAEVGFNQPIGQIISAPPQLHGDQNRSMMHPRPPEQEPIEVQQQEEKQRTPPHRQGLSLHESPTPDERTSGVTLRADSDHTKASATSLGDQPARVFSLPQALQQQGFPQQGEAVGPSIAAAQFSSAHHNEAANPLHETPSLTAGQLAAQRTLLAPQADGALHQSTGSGASLPDNVNQMQAHNQAGATQNQFQAEPMISAQHAASSDQVPTQNQSSSMIQPGASWLHGSQSFNFQRPEASALGTQQQAAGYGFQSQLQANFLAQQQQQQLQQQLLLQQQQQQQGQPTNMFPMEHQIWMQQQMMGMNSSPFQQQEDQAQRLDGGFGANTLLDGGSSHLNLGISPQQQNEVLGALSDLEDDEEEAKGSPRKQTRKRRAKAFPEKFMEALVGYANDDVIAWLPDGKSFVVVNDEAFVQDVLSKHFKAAKYSSFVRKLHRWGFVRLSSGTGTDCFHHPLFQKDRLDLAAQIKSAPRGGSKSGKAKEAAAAAATTTTTTGVEHFMQQKLSAAVSTAPAVSAPPAISAPQALPQPQHSQLQGLPNAGLLQSNPFPQQFAGPAVGPQGMANPPHPSDLEDVLEPDPFPSNHNHPWGS